MLGTIDLHPLVPLTPAPGASSPLQSPATPLPLTVSSRLWIFPQSWPRSSSTTENSTSWAGIRAQATRRCPLNIQTSTSGRGGWGCGQRTESRIEVGPPVPTASTGQMDKIPILALTQIRKSQIHVPTCFLAVSPLDAPQATSHPTSFLGGGFDKIWVA